MTVSSRATEWHRMGLVAVSGAVTCWGIGNILVRQVDLPGLELAFWRLVLSSVIYVGIVLARRGRVTWAQFRACLPPAVMVGLWLITFYESIKSTTVTNVSMIVSLSPVVLLWAAVRRFAEPVSLKLLALVAAALAGTSLVLFGSTSVPTWSLRGDGLAVLALLCFSANMALSKEARQKVGVLEFQAIVWSVAMVVVAPPAILLSDDLSFPDTSTWLWVLVLLAVPGSGHLLMNWAHKHVRITVSSMALLGAPPITMVGAALFLDEPIKIAQVVGGVIVIAAVAAVIRRDLQITARHGTSTA
ncbi:MAG: DMT family transporter [Acidimicrobiaceae bacterium]|nr:DMT family transporter [Acidimicrobiaceae bacterium]MCY3645339.1 DMT family transporter [Acidimicrobiaceae bacterium]MDE0663965.1 DMT family transporter [Acidimicrobiaceae bacterium]MXW89633.1 DMT family transporter [Acidimicrobiaceae bacterium]MXY11354.1 DMT family transporter [Acidimicrobiaceae bacterium]